ncbi:MAG: tryptophan--tRNA ligase [Patescibacteria group bacterium]|nr:tryptophan--tRNA ligase [Patescibacteria group bacterium]
MSKGKKNLLSGVKPTGRPHIGNYFGAMKQFADLQNQYQTSVMIANYHDLGSGQTPGELRQNTLDAAIDHLAIGLDPQRITLFRQADVPEHAELAWIFNSLVTVPYLQRAHAYKDAVAKGKEATMTLFAYPVLMATDILMYNTHVVPVGKDQQQHVEIARDIAEKFNHCYGKLFNLPEALILEEVAVVPGIDGQKMSKSYGNTIPLFASDEEIKKAVMGIVTDSDSGRPENVYAIHKLLKPADELDPLYEEKAGKYKDLKEALLEDMIAFIAVLRERREEIASDIDQVEQILKNGADQARERAMLKMKQVRLAVGLD